jgi:hypothetical protein
MSQAVVSSERSATTSTSIVDRGSPCTELASDPPTTYGMRALSSRFATSSAIARTSGSSSGFTLRRPLDPGGELRPEPTRNRRNVEFVRGERGMPPRQPLELEQQYGRCQRT